MQRSLNKLTEVSFTGEFKTLVSTLGRCLAHQKPLVLQNDIIDQRGCRHYIFITVSTTRRGTTTCQGGALNKKGG